MNYSSLTYVIENRVATITLNRPERRNSLDDVMIKELTDILGLVNRNTTSRVIVLTGAGESFCAGMDLDYLQRYSKLGEMENLEDARNFMRLLQLIHTLKKPIIAMVNGPALGGGCGIAAACDYVFAGRKRALIGTPEVKLGFLPALILVYLIKRMGEGATRELVLRGGVLNAEEAMSKGLVTEVIDDGKLAPTVLEFASKLASTTSASSITLTKELFSRLTEMNSIEFLEYAASLNAMTRRTDDFKKGIESFLSKEKLEW